MCEYRGSLPRRALPMPAPMPALPCLASVEVEEARLIVLGRRLHLRLATCPLGQRLSPTVALRLQRYRAATASLVCLCGGYPPDEELLQPLLEGLEQCCTEAERLMWLECVADALQVSRLPAAAANRLWRWFEVLSLRLLRPAVVFAQLRYLHPPLSEAPPPQAAGSPWNPPPAQPSAH